MSSSTEFITPGSAARLLGISRQHVHNLARAGTLPSIMLPGQPGKAGRFLRLDDVIRLREERDARKANKKTAKPPHKVEAPAATGASEGQSASSSTKDVNDHGEA